MHRPAPSALYDIVESQPNVEVVRATELTSGPWRPDAQHGGPPSAMLGRAIERLVAPDQTLLRVSVELTRGVPLGDLIIRSGIERVSGRVWRGSATLEHDGSSVARASGLILAAADIPTPSWIPSPVADQPPSTAGAIPPDWSAGQGGLRYHRDAVEHRFVAGSFTDAGAATDWIKLRYPLVGGETTSGWCLALAIADFGSGVSAVYDYADFGLINADLDVAIHRPPIGDWVKLDAITQVGRQGTGLCTSRLSDTGGQFGTATQALLGYGSSSATKVT